MTITESIPSGFVRPAWATSWDAGDFNDVSWCAGEFKSGDLAVSINRIDLREPSATNGEVTEGSVDINICVGDEQVWIDENPAEGARELARLLLLAADEYDRTIK